MKKIFLEDVKPGDAISFNTPGLEHPYVYHIVLSKNQFGVNAYRIDDRFSRNEFMKYSVYSERPFYLYSLKKGNNFTIKIEKVS